MNLPKLRPPTFKKLSVISCIIFLNISLFELASAFAVFGIGRLIPRLRIDTFVESYISKGTNTDYFGKMYHQDLGWDYLPKSQLQGINVLGQKWISRYGEEGERQGLHLDLPVLAAAYGDSFVHGDEVNTQNTWENYLEQILGGQVINFGVGGYGTDQAYLKFKLHTQLGKVAPITILGIFEGDISRISTNFRPFVTPDSNIRPGFKPAFVYIRPAENLSIYAQDESRRIHTSQAGLM